MIRRYTTSCHTIAALFAVLLFAASARADTVSYNFFVDTSGIAALSPAGGWLDFEFNQANALDSLSAIATITNFTSTGYTFGPTVQTSAGVTGLLPGPIAIPNDQGAANFFTQEVTAWGGSFAFEVTLSGPAVGTAAPDGSAFYAYLLDPGFNQIVSPSTSTGEILNVTIDSAGGTTPQATAFTGGSSTAIPEPGAAWLALTALALLAIGRLRSGRSEA